MVRMAGSSALIGHGMLERRRSVCERREGRLGGGSRRHSGAWWRAGGERVKYGC